jgi:hypothetical protein
MCLPVSWDPAEDVVSLCYIITYFSLLFFLEFSSSVVVSVIEVWMVF